MATEEQKKENLVRLMGMTIRGLALGIWDMVEESSLALGPSMGEQLLQVMEKEMGLELAGEDRADVLNEVARLFVDEFGFAQHVDVAPTEGGAAMIVHNCALLKLTGQLSEDGVEPFLCPYRNVVAAGAKRGNIKMRSSVDFAPELKKCTITFKAI